MKNRKILVTALLISAVTVTTCKGNSERFQTETPRLPLSEYTKEAHGEWAGLEEEHYPRVTINKDDMENIIINVKFPIKHDPDHYIEKIGIMDEKGNDVIIKKFNRTAEFFQARFNVPFYNKKWKAYARCSLHDLWTAPLE